MKNIKAGIEAILFATGKSVTVNELEKALNIEKEVILKLLEEIKNDYENAERGVELIQVNEGYQLCTKKDYYNCVYNIIDNRSKPNLSKASLETLSIIAYNNKITKAEIESIRGVNSDGTVYKLLEYELIEEARKNGSTR